ncbi:hypothetical protein C8R43DRAFT_965679 [Mycena crocata]|nr:hypothetical protein C8R43DRAFT_965679 [Mycena crocata]
MCYHKYYLDIGRNPGIVVTQKHSSLSITNPATPFTMSLIIHSETSARQQPLDLTHLGRISVGIYVWVPDNKDLGGATGGISRGMECKEEIAVVICTHPLRLAQQSINAGLPPTPASIESTFLSSLYLTEGEMEVVEVGMLGKKAACEGRILLGVFPARGKSRLMGSMRSAWRSKRIYLPQQCSKRKHPDNNDTASIESPLEDPESKKGISTLRAEQEGARWKTHMKTKPAHPLGLPEMSM